MRRLVLIAAAAAVLVVSCGPQDVTPPEVVSVTPVDGSGSVRLDVPFKVEFSEPLALASFAAGSVTFEVGGQKLDVEVEQGGNAQTMLIRAIQQPRQLPATATVSLTAAIKDRVGNPLQPYSWSFELADWIALGEVINQDPNEDAENFSLAWFAGPVLAWSEQEGAAPTIFIARWDDSTSSWVRLGETLDIVRADAASHPKLRVVDGRLNVVWNEVDSRSHHAVYHAVWTADGWSYTPQQLNHDTQRNAYVPVVTRSGAMRAVWFEKSSRTYYGVWSGYDGSGWSAGPDFATSAQHAYACSATNAKGELWVAYKVRDISTYVTTWDGSSWQSRGQPDGDGLGTSRSQCVRLASDSGENVYAAWYEANAWKEYVARWDGAAWSLMGSGALGSAAVIPAMASIRGELFIAYADEVRQGGTRVFVARWDPIASSWQELGGPVSRSGSIIEIDLTSDGAWPLVAWTEDDGGVWLLRAARYNHIQ